MPKLYSIYDGIVFSVRLYKEAQALGGLPRVSEISNLTPNAQWLKIRAREQLEGALKFKEQNTDCSLEAMTEAGILYQEGIKNDAKDAGTDIHALLDALQKEIYYSPQFIGNELKEAIVKAYERFTKEFITGHYTWIKSEFNILNRTIGYGGRCDGKLINTAKTPVYIDWKSQNVKRLKSGEARPEFHKDWAAQLWAYGYADTGTQDFEILSVVVDRMTGDMFPYKWTSLELESGREMFKRLHWLYCHTHDYEIDKVIENYHQKKLTNIDT